MPVFINEIRIGACNNLKRNYRKAETVIRSKHSKSGLGPFSIWGILFINIGWLSMRGLLNRLMTIRRYVKNGLCAKMPARKPKKIGG